MSAPDLRNWFAGMLRVAAEETKSLPANAGIKELADLLESKTVEMLSVMNDEERNAALSSIPGAQSMRIWPLT